MDLLFDIGDGTPICVTAEAYPDGTPYFTYDSLSFFGRGPAYPQSRLLLRPRSLHLFYAALWLVDAMAARNIPTPHLILPLVPGSRQDRLNPTGDYLFTLRSIARDINLRSFPSVTVVDPHSSVTPALIDRCRVVTAADGLEMTGWTGKWGRWSAVVSPDGGAEKRAGEVAEKLNLPLIHAWKHRDVKTGKLSGFGVDSSALDYSSKLLLVDDLCDGGGTFVGLAQEITKLGATKQGGCLDLYVTHGLFSQGVTGLLGHFGRIITTDSSLTAKVAAERAAERDVKERIYVTDVCDRLLKGAM